MKKVLLIVIFFHLFTSFQGQVVYSDPALPLADESLVVFFNAIDTPLEDYSGIVYAHTGLIKNENSAWSNVIGTWGDNTSQPALTALGNHLYSLEITPDIRTYYDAEESDEIEEMAFVFRSADGATQSADLFLEVYEAGLHVAISSPAISPFFVDPDQDIIIEANANGAEQIHLYVDDILITSIAGNVLNYTLQASTATGTKSWIKVVANGNGDMASDSVYYYVRGTTQIEDLPINVRDGINIIDDNTVTLVLLAPNKNSVFVHGDFNGWEIGPEFSMKRNTASPGDEWARYWVTISGLNPGEEYAFQYIINEELLIADPYADKILDQANDPYITESVYPGLKNYPQGKTTGIVSVFETGQEAYQWQHNDFAVPQITDLVIYEMLVRDFTDAHTYAMVADTLDYLEELGINVLELMPVNEFEGNSSWGYNPSFYFAPDKYYGPKNELKRLIDECHSRGIAVVLDIVLNHSYDQSPLVQMYFDGNKPTADNPWYNVNSNFANPDAQWGNDFNHESQYTKNFMDSVNSYWMSEYRIDGFRFDFTKGFSNTYHSMADPWGSNYDAARINILKRMMIQIRARNEDAFVILEHLSENSEEENLASFGMLMWGNLNYNYSEASMGYNEDGKSDFSGISYQKRNWDDPQLVGYMESHDEERMMFKNISYGNSEGAYNIKETGIALARARLAATFFYTIPGPKMLWQFGELGYDYSIDFNGRLGEKPVRWDYLDDWQRSYNYRFLSSLIKLTTEYDVFETEEFFLNVSGAMKSIRLDHSSMNVLIAGNFDVQAGEIACDFAHTGEWYEYFTGEILQVSDVNMQLNLAAGDYRLYTDVQLETPDIGTSIIEGDNQKGATLRIFPNPVLFEARLIFEVEESTEISIGVFDLLGREVINLGESYYQEGVQEVEINMNGLDSGLYFVKIFSKVNSDTIKFLKQ